jgi:RNA polymerase sigma-70 factor (ECF subfamily)
LETFESQREGSLLAYLRQIVLNQVRDAARGVARRPGRDPLPEEAADRCRSPLEETVGRETMEAYDAALADLSEEQRHAVILRIELGYGYSQIAEAVGSPTPNAARMLVTRALLRLAQAMDGHREGR